MLGPSTDIPVLLDQRHFNLVATPAAKRGESNVAIVQCGRWVAGLACSVVVAVAAGGAPPGHAQGLLDATCPVGSRFPIVDYQDYPTNTIGRGHNMAAFLRGKDASNADKEYMMLVWSRDSGKGEGGISFWNWDTPADLERAHEEKTSAGVAASRSPLDARHEHVRA